MSERIHCRDALRWDTFIFPLHPLLDLWHLQDQVKTKEQRNYKITVVLEGQTLVISEVGADRDRAEITVQLIGQEGVWTQDRTMFIPPHRIISISLSEGDVSG